MSSDNRHRGGGGGGRNNVKKQQQQRAEDLDIFIATEDESANCNNDDDDVRGIRSKWGGRSRVRSQKKMTMSNKMLFLLCLIGLFATGLRCYSAITKTSRRNYSRKRARPKKGVAQKPFFLPPALPKIEKRNDWIETTNQILAKFQVGDAVLLNQTQELSARLRHVGSFPEIALVTLQTGYDEWEWADCNFRMPKIDYCKIHGYDFFDETTFPRGKALVMPDWMYIRGKDDKPKEGRYQKLQFLELLLREELPYKWFFWIDADIAINQPNISIENRMQKVHQILLQEQHGNKIPEEPIFVMAEDIHGLNNGVWLIRNNRETHQIIREMFYHPLRNPGTGIADQVTVVDYLFRHKPFKTEKMWMVPPRFFQVWQSYLGRGEKYHINEATPAEGPWLYHMAGMPMEDRFENLKRLNLWHPTC